MKLVVSGLSHHTAPLEVRERVALLPDEMPHALSALVSDGGLREALVLSTCNRTEVYGRLDDSAQAADGIRSLERIRPGLGATLAEHGYERNGDAALEHLFRVAAGLDSLVVGEHEIAGQVSRAYDFSRRAGTAGPLLHRVVPRALQVGKLVRTETKIATGIASVAGAAVGLADRVFRDPAACSVLAIGAGQTIETALRALRGTAQGRLVVANRSPERAASVAGLFGGEPRPLLDAAGLLAEVDIVIAAVDVAEPVLTRDHIAEHTSARNDRPLLVLDLGVPRNVDTAARDLSGVYLHDLDDLHAIADRGRRQRVDEIPRAEALVVNAVSQFRRRRRELEAEPAIRALLDGLLHVRRGVVDGDSELEDSERAAVERVTGRMVDRLVRRLAPRVKDGTVRPDQILDAFGLELPSIEDDEDSE